jgi:YidC/Oxa1 family membrane protein insertase
LELILFVWNQILLGPATNFIIVLDRLLFGSYGLAIIVFTIVLRLVTLPLTLRQMNSSKKMSTLQPKLQEIQKKYSDPKRRSEETMKLYKEEGVNPAGCLIPTLIQFPIWIALYQVIRITLGTTPESLIDLSHRLYPWSFVQEAVPLASHFLWLNLGAPDRTFILPILVFATMWLQQKLTMTQTTMQAGSQTAQTNQMMLWFLPLLFAYFSTSVPSGLALYWVITNFAGIALNYFVFDWHGKHPMEIMGLRDFKLSKLNPLAMFAPPPRGGRPSGRPQPTGRGRDGATARNQSRDEAPAESVATPLRTPRNGASNRQRQRNSGPAQRKNQPKAPPVTRPGQPSGENRTGRLESDPAGGYGDAGNNGGSETRSNDGRGS